MVIFIKCGLIQRLQPLLVFFTKRFYVVLGLKVKGRLEREKWLDNLLLIKIRLLSIYNHLLNLPVIDLGFVSKFKLRYA